MDALTICVNYGDYLAVTLHSNRRFFDRYVVVTDMEDDVTPGVCAELGAECIRTDAFYRDGTPFAKGLALEEGLQYLGLEGWIAIVDADILIPDGFESAPDGLEPDALYGPIKKHHSQYNETGFNTHNNGTACAGFLQVFNGKMLESLNIGHPSTTGHCGLDDILFSLAFPRVGHLNITAYHLGPKAPSGEDNVNWHGRQSEPCPYTIEDIPELLEGAKQEQSIKKYVHVSSNENQDYIQFWPLIAAAWRRLGVKPVLTLVTDKPESEWIHMSDHGDVIYRATRSDIDPGIWSKVARWHSYGSFPDSLNIVSCIDMIPINAAYFESLFQFSRDVLVLAGCDAYLSHTSKKNMNTPKFPGNYMITYGDIWKQIVNPDGLGMDAWIAKWMHSDVYDGKESLCSPYDVFSEESMMRVAVYEWDKNRDKIVGMRRPGGWDYQCSMRIDRLNWHWSKELLSQGRYIDAHCPRPMADHRDSLEQLCRDINLDPALVQTGIDESKWAAQETTQ